MSLELNEFDKIQKLHDDSFKSLTKLGISENRCHNGLAAVGLEGKQEAASWLARHVDKDTSIDSRMLWNIYIFLCPSDNSLLSLAVRRFWFEAEQMCEWNPAFDYPPHITLLPQFDVFSNQIWTLKKVCYDVVAKFQQDLTHGLINECLEMYANSEPNFMGLVIKGHMKKMLIDLSNNLANSLAQNGIVIEADKLNKRKRIFHVSLAYGYSDNETHEFKRIFASCLPLEVFRKPCEWEFHIYSRDNRLSLLKDFELIRTLEVASSRGKSSNVEEDFLLDYSVGDLVAAGLRTGPEVPAFNLSTGAMGTLLAGQLGKRLPQSHCWVLQLRLALSQKESELKDSTSNELVSDFLEGSNSLSSISPEMPNNKSCKSSLISSFSDPSGLKKKRKVLVMRHGERVDFCFGKDWIHRCFNARNEYIRCNLNMPRDMVRDRSLVDLLADPPLTEIGHLVSFYIGRSLMETNMAVDVCFSSPALRCVQTANQMLRGLMQPQVPIRVEPHLFEWLGWYEGRVPNFMTSRQLKACGYRVDDQYQPLSGHKDWPITELVEQFHERSVKLIRRLLDANRKSAVLLIVGHGTTLDCAHRALSRASSFSWSAGRASLSSLEAALQFGGRGEDKQEEDGGKKNFCQRVSRVPYFGLMMFEESNFHKWALVPPPIPPFSQSATSEMNWRFLG